MGKLDSKVALITGGSTGIGRATAKRFVEEGAQVFIVGRRRAELDEAAAAIGHNVSAIQCDVTSSEDLDRVYETVRNEKGVLDIVVVGAGFVESAMLDAVTPAHFDKTFGVNALAALFTVQKALPLMTRGGSIILISSGMHIKGTPGFTTYAATKAALRSYVRTWAAELKDRGIRANALTCGPTDTPMFSRLASTPKEKSAIEARFASMIPLGRVARPEEAAAGALFLASDDSSFTTGSELLVDGGLTQV